MDKIVNCHYFCSFVRAVRASVGREGRVVNRMSPA